MRSIVILPLVGLRLVGCASTVSFEETTSLAVPATITACVDPRRRPAGAAGIDLHELAAHPHGRLCHRLL
jgi:hypothetical protein